MVINLKFALRFLTGMPLRRPSDWH